MGISQQEAAGQIPRLAGMLEESLLLPLSLRAFVLLQVPDILGAHNGMPLTAPQIAAHIPGATHEGSAVNLERILQFLAVHGFLQQHHNDVTDPDVVDQACRYQLTGMGSLFHPSMDCGSLLSARKMLLMKTEGAVLQAMVIMHQAVLEPDVPVFEIANQGQSMYEHMSQPKASAFADNFNGFQHHHSQMAMTSILKVSAQAGFGKISSIVDVGGGVGTCMEMLVKEFPTIRAINFDLPHVVGTAHVIPGVEHVGGDMFVSIPSGEAIFLKFILHNWDDKHCIQILKNCFTAIPKFGKVIIVEILMPFSIDPTKDAFLLNLDLTMMIHHNGRERTKKQYQDLIVAAGFSDLKVVFTLERDHYNLSIMEVTK